MLVKSFTGVDQVKLLVHEEVGILSSSVRNEKNKKYLRNFCMCNTTILNKNADIKYKGSLVTFQDRCMVCKNNIL